MCACRPASPKPVRATSQASAGGAAGRIGGSKANGICAKRDTRTRDRQFDQRSLHGTPAGELGAEVVKVENPKGGDPFRSFTSDGYSAQFCAYNTNKRSVTLDIARPAGREVLLKLLPTCDVLVQNFRPGVMERLGLGWDELSAVNSRLIYCSVSGFGQSGPYKHRPAYDTVAGESRVYSANSSRPRRLASLDRRWLIVLLGSTPVMAFLERCSSAPTPATAAALTWR